MDDNPQILQAYYLTKYDQIVKPKVHFSVSKYLLREWSRYLSPNQLFGIIAIEQLAFRHGKNQYDGSKVVSGFNNQVMDLVQMQKSTLKRVKASFTEEHAAGHFVQIKKESINTRDKKGRLRGTATKYRINGSTPLTPTHSIHLTNKFKSHLGTSPTVDNLLGLFSDWKKQSKHYLLENTLVINDSPTANYPLTIQQIVKNLYPQLYNGSVGKSLQANCDILHHWIVGGDLLVPHYFWNWMPYITPGAARLWLYLRSRTFKGENETRNLINNISLGEIEEVFNVKRNTSKAWIKTLTEPRSPQTPFLTIINKKIVNKRTTYSFEVGIDLPMTPADIKMVDQEADRQLINSEPRPDRQLINSEPRPEGQPVNSEPRPEGQPVNSEPSTCQFWTTLKHYKHFFPNVTTDQQTHDDDGWLDQSFLDFVLNSKITMFNQLVGINTTHTNQNIVKRSSLTLEEMAVLLWDRILNGERSRSRNGEYKHKLVPFILSKMGQKKLNQLNFDQQFMAQSLNWSVKQWLEAAFICVAAQNKSVNSQYQRWIDIFGLQFFQLFCDVHAIKFQDAMNRYIAIDVNYELNQTDTHILPQSTIVVTDEEKAWGMVCDELQRTLATGTYKKWIKNVKVGGKSENKPTVLNLIAPNKDSVEVINLRLKSTIESLLSSFDLAQTEISVAELVNNI